MKKVLYLLLLVLSASVLNYSQITTLWEKSAAAGTKPIWEAGSTTRGLSYGLVGSNHRLFVVNRNAAIGGKQIIIFNAATGDSVGVLDTTGLSGGTFPINDVEVSTNGKIFVCNVTTNALTDTFRVYKFDNESSAPVAVIKYVGASGERYGDKFTVTGSTADNSIIIWVTNSAINGNILKFKTTDNGATFTPEVVSKATTGSSTAVGPLPNGDFYYSYHGGTPQKYTADGTLIGTVPGTVISTSGSAVRYLRTFMGSDFIVANELLSPTTNNAKIIQVPVTAPASATTFGITPVLGATSAGGLGDVSIQKVNDYTYNIFALSTNNGFGAYQVNLRPALSGNYYIGAAGTGPGGTDPHFATLRDAFDVLNEASFTSDCTFFITSNITETYAAPSYGLGLAINPAPYKVTFKPYTGVQPVITLTYPLDGTSGPSGALVIGLPSKGNVAWDSMKTTKNIVIDGSNTTDGITRDLTIECATTANRNGFPLTIVGDVSDMVVKNTNIYYKAQGVSTSGNLFVGAVHLRSRNYLGVNWVPHNILFENNHISSNFDGVVQSAQGYITYQSGTPLPLDYPYNITLKNNLIEGKRRAVALYRAGSHDIIGNEIILNQDIAANTTNEAIYAVDVDTNSVVNIGNNKISKISSKTNAASNGNAGISIESLGTYNVYNNFIHGFGLTAENPVAYLYGIKNSSASAVLNCYFNTIYLDNLSSIGSGTVTYNGLLISNGTNDVKNNIVYAAETDFVSYCINRPGTTGTLLSDYNDYYKASSAIGNVGYWNTAAAPSLTDWKTASSLDNNSISSNPQFTSTSDLHLSSHFVPVVGSGISIPGFGFDIDGELRDTPPEMGADEFPGITPVELTSFTAVVQNDKVKLEWKTVTETNNYGFEIERKSETTSWNTIGNIKGKGTTTEVQNYSFIDSDLPGGKLSYRLKQIDFNGSFSYSDVVEVDASMPKDFELLQNYPNPFNPSTAISFLIPVDSKVKLEIFSVTGEAVEILVNDYLTAGRHSYNFNAANFASGTYIYRLTAGSIVLTKKMTLMK